MRDPTRCGLAGVLADIVEDSGLSVHVDEAALPVVPDVNIAGYQPSVREQVQMGRELFARKPLNAEPNGNLKTYRPKPHPNRRGHQ